MLAALTLGREQDWDVSFLHNHRQPDAYGRA
jgi:hypothetical protein